MPPSACSSRPPTRYPLEPAAFLVLRDGGRTAEPSRRRPQALIDYGALVADDRGFVARATRIAALSLRLERPARRPSNGCERAIAGSPNDVRLLASLAEAQLSAGDRGGAQATIARGLEKDPENPRSSRSRGDAEP